MTSATDIFRYFIAFEKEHRCIYLKCGGYKMLLNFIYHVVFEKIYIFVTHVKENRVKVIRNSGSAIFASEYIRYFLWPSFIHVIIRTVVLIYKFTCKYRRNKLYEGLEYKCLLDIMYTLYLWQNNK